MSSIYAQLGNGPFKLKYHDIPPSEQKANGLAYDALKARVHEVLGTGDGSNANT